MRKAGGSSAGRSPRRRGGMASLLNRKNLARLAALAALVILVVPTLLVVLLQDRSPAQDPALLSLLARLEENPQDYAALVELGNYYSQQGWTWLDRDNPEQGVRDFGAAAVYYERALVLNPVEEDLQLARTAALYYQAFGYLRLGQVEAALSLWRRVVELSPGSPYAQDAQNQIDQYGKIGP